MGYADIFVADQNRMVADVIRSFVEREIMPVRQQIDDDSDHVIVRRILQGHFNLGLMRASLPQEYGGMAAAGPGAGTPPAASASNTTRGKDVNRQCSSP